jgi:hypothetical protein
MSWDDAIANVMAARGWSEQKTRYAVDYFQQNQGPVDLGTAGFVEAFGADATGTWVDDFGGTLPAMIAASLTQAESAYNTMTNNQPFVPGQQYVQNNGDGSFTTVVTYTSLAVAEAGYNSVTYGGQPFVPGKRYVQDDHDGSYKVVVRYPLDY